VPKRENFFLAFFTLSEPTWVCDLGTEQKNVFFYYLTPDLEGFWFFATYLVHHRERDIAFKKEEKNHQTSQLGVRPGQSSKQLWARTLSSQLP
jgi:hypothetical protein